EFMLRRETRGLRMQLEMLKPEIEQQALGIEHTVVVFGSARFLAPDHAQLALHAAKQDGDSQVIALAEQKLRNAKYYDQARLFARLVAGYGARRPAKERLYICTGGGPGIMEAANRGAHDLGALTVGLNIALPHEQSANPYVSPSLNFKFHYFAMRKMHFMMRAKALVAFPGGMGTLDELFEVLTLVQTRKAKPVPIILFGTEYWKNLVNFDVMVQEGTISKEDLALFTYTDDPQVAWDTIRLFYELKD
ncbi:MAG: TIGR00730 family Rossman fold protein, partial [Burkholderiaceae bacterium]